MTKQLTLSDLEFQDNMYYVGGLVDVDGSPWVPKNIALKVLDHVNLKLQAKEYYFQGLEVEEWKQNFLEKLATHEVYDKRDKGYYCCYCGTISEKPIAFASENKTIFPRRDKNHIWIVNEHYDGCRGWD